MGAQEICLGSGPHFVSVGGKPRVRMPPPKKRFTRYWTKRRHLLQYIDKYRWIFKVRKNNMEARKYIAPMFVKDYKSPEFRHPGFWPGSFGYHQAQNLLLPLPSIDRRIGSSGGSGGDREGPFE